MTPTAIHVHPVQEEDDRCEAAWQPSMPSIMEVLSCTSNSVFVFIVFCNIPQPTEYLLPYFVAFIPQE